MFICFIHCYISSLEHSKCSINIFKPTNTTLSTTHISIRVFSSSHIVHLFLNLDFFSLLLENESYASWEKNHTSEKISAWLTHFVPVV